MKIIEQSHSIETDITDPMAIYRTIERAGRTCYKSETKDPPTNESTRAFVRRLVTSGHHSVLEHVSLTVRFITDRGVTHELVRHRLAAYSQESTRYCDYSGEMEVVRPVWCRSAEGFQHFDGTDLTEPERLFVESSQRAEDFYKALRKLGWSPQQARAVLPNSLKTEIVMTANLREWMHVLKLRTSPAAHPQIRALMLPLQKELAYWLPDIFAV